MCCDNVERLQWLSSFCQVDVGERRGAFRSLRHLRFAHSPFHKWRRSDIILARCGCVQIGRTFESVSGDAADLGCGTLPLLERCSDFQARATRLVAYRAGRKPLS
mmetsp:Transcript_255/g.413  ORF Transcript_255/g.413 Transcript_255/m.413 type:complete len:105 (+) Transcript_255:38-352(+)